MSQEAEETFSEENGQAAPAILIVGCRGRMGKMLLERSQKLNLPVSGVDIPYSDEMAKTVRMADIVIACVPAGKLREVLEKLTPWMKTGAILSDITSVKEQPMRIMEEIWPGPVVGTHPLFGPCPDPEDDLPVVIVPGSRATPEDARKVAAFFSKLGFRTFESDAAAHDEAMAKIQNMNFITNVAYFAALAGQKDLLPFITPSFSRRQNAARKMLTEDAEMFTGLFEANAHSHEVVRQFRKYLNVAASGDIDLLCKRAQWWWQKKEDSSH